jgi:hypothetical protein
VFRVTAHRRSFTFQTLSPPNPPAVLPSNSQSSASSSPLTRPAFWRSFTRRIVASPLIPPPLSSMRQSSMTMSVAQRISPELLRQTQSVIVNWPPL